MKKLTNTKSFEKFKKFSLNQTQEENVRGALYSEYCQRETDNFAEGIENYLCYGNVNGIGPDDVVEFGG